MAHNPLPDYDDLPKTADNVGSGWGLFGENDSVGLINLLSPERIAAAARLVRRGVAFPLNLPLDAIRPGLYGRGAPRHNVFRLPDGNLDDVLDNVFPQAASQWDALGHVCFNDTFYNGARYEDVISGRRNTIDHWARRGILGRAVLLDVQRALSLQGRTYAPETPNPLTVADLELARELAGVEYAPGDILLVRTGFLEWYVAQDDTTKAALVQRPVSAAGIERSEAMARYIWNAHACAVAADNPAVATSPADKRPEAWPFGDLHGILVVQFGLALGELWWLADLAADCARDGVYEMFLTSAPLNVPGGVGSPANALAIK
jgi:hypothetical protein